MINSPPSYPKPRAPRNPPALRVPAYFVSSCMAFTGACYSAEPMTPVTAQLTNCVNCGAPLQAHETTCSYCKTSYQLHLR